MAALLRQVDGRRTLGRLRVGDLEVDPPSREVRLRGAPDGARGTGHHFSRRGEASGARRALARQRFI